MADNLGYKLYGQDPTNLVDSCGKFETMRYLGNLKPELLAAIFRCFVFGVIGLYFYHKFFQLNCIL